MLCGITVIDNNVIHYAAETRKAIESFIHTSVIMFRYGGDSLRCTHIFKSAKWHYESSEKLTFFIKRALMVALHGIQNSRKLACLADMSAMASARVSDWYLSLFTYRFRCERSTHIHIQSLFFLDAMTIGMHQSVASVAGAIMLCDRRR